MSVKCVSNRQFPLQLTEGKIYSVIKETPSCYIIENDKGVKTWYGKRSFVSWGG